MRKILDYIPDSHLEELSEQFNIDHQVKYLHGSLIFKLIIFSLISDGRTSTRSLEKSYNSVYFSALTDKGGHKTRHSSLASRIGSIRSEYFEALFYYVQETYGGEIAKESKSIPLVRYDSTMVSIGAGLIKFGMQVGKKATTGNGKLSLKFTIGLNGFLPCSASLHTAQSYLNEDMALGEAVLDASHDKNNIVSFDRGLQKRQTLAEIAKDTVFVTRANAYIKYKVKHVHKQIKGRKSDKLVFEEDLIVHLYDRKGKKIEQPFRLIKARNWLTGSPVYFLTNIDDLPASRIAQIYARRWDIEVFFKFIKQELNFSHLVSRSENGIKVMLYMTLITAILLIVYKVKNRIKGYRAAKRLFLQELEIEIIADIVEAYGGDRKQFYKTYT